MADIDAEVILSVALVLSEGTELSLGVVPALCDIETTLMIDTKHTVDKVIREGKGTKILTFKQPL